MNAPDRVLLTLSDPEGRVRPPAGSGWVPQLSAEELCRRALFHGVHGTVLANLQGASAEAWPASWRDAAIRALAPVVRIDAARGMLLSAYGLRMCRALEAAGLPALLLKGADFADHLYPRPALRSFTDIDLLVRPEDFARAGRVLLEEGCVRHSDGPLKHAAAYGEEVYLLTVAGVTLRVELHWNLVNSPSLHRTVHVVLDDLLDNAGGFGHEGRLLLAAVHAGSGRQFDRLKFLVDLLQLLRRGETMNLPWLAKRAGRTGSNRVLATACWLVATLFKSPEARIMGRRLGLTPPPFWCRWLLSPPLVMRGLSPRGGDGLRKNLFRQYLKGGGPVRLPANDQGAILSSHGEDAP